jgi:hypothetical protein
VTGWKNSEDPEFLTATEAGRSMPGCDEGEIPFVDGQGMIQSGWTPGSASVSPPEPEGTDRQGGAAVGAGEPASSPAGELLQHGRNLLTHLVDAVQAIPPTDEEEAQRLAAIFERLSEESAQAAAMTRALPDRPAKRPGHPFPAVVAVITAAEIEHDFGGWLAGVLRRAAAYVSSAEHPVMSRPGPWEAGQVTVLATAIRGAELGAQSHV